MYPEYFFSHLSVSHLSSNKLLFAVDEDYYRNLQVKMQRTTTKGNFLTFHLE